MRIPFTKMHGIGNDFVLLDATASALPLSAETVARLGDRHRGVGFDQLLVAERAGEAPVAMRIFNTDGTAAGQCGNGLRCFARFARERGLVADDEFEVDVAGQRALVRLGADGAVLARLGVPRHAPADVPILAAARAPTYALEVDGERFEVGAVSVGNPHVVLVVDDVDRAPVERLGPLIQSSDRLPDSANVGFVEIIDRGHVRLRVYERGVGETQACGSGACAAVVCARERGLLDAEVRVDLPGGTLEVRWAGEGEPVWMSGPTAKVFEGELDL